MLICIVVLKIKNYRKFRPSDGGNLRGRDHILKLSWTLFFWGKAGYVFENSSKKLRCTTAAARLLQQASSLIA